MKYIKLYETFASDEAGNDVTDVIETSADLKDAESILKGHTVELKDKDASSPLFHVNQCDDKPGCLLVELIPYPARQAGLQPGIFGLWKFYIDSNGTITSEYDGKPGMSYDAESPKDAANYLISNVNEFLKNRPN